MKRLLIFTIFFPPLALVVFNAPDMIAHRDFKLMDATTTQTGTISGDFQQSFLIDQTVSQGAHTQKGTIRGRRVGDCPAKFKPGDLVDAGGDKLGNLLG